MKNLIHKSSEVQTNNIGKDTQVWQFTVILKYAKIGNNCNINSHCFIENDVVIGNNVTVKCGVYLWDGLIIEDNVHIGPNVTFTNDKYPRSKKNFEVVKTYIMKGATIGASSTILCGVKIGEYAMIGTGSLVTKDVPPFTLWFGHPASQKGYVTMEGEILDMNMTSRSGQRFQYVDLKLLPLK